MKGQEKVKAYSFDEEGVVFEVDLELSASAKEALKSLEDELGINDFTRTIRG